MTKVPVGTLSSPKPTSYYSMEQITLVTQCLALLGFVQYAIIFSQSLINVNIFYLCDKSLILKSYLTLSRTNAYI